MKVFISWSGAKSKDFANQLRGWLPFVLQDLRPWVSDMDIDSGTLSMAEIHAQLSDTAYGIIVTTSENQARSWINYEAGALWKSIDVVNKVVPILLDLDLADLTSPLKNFQLRQFKKHDDRKSEFKKLVISLNNARPYPLAQHVLDESFENHWSKMEAIFKRIETNDYAYKPEMTSTDLRLEDIQQLVLKLDQSSRATLTGVEQILDHDHNEGGEGRGRESSGTRESRFEKIINDSLIARGSIDRAHVKRIDKRHYVVYSAHRIPDEVKAAAEEINAQVPYLIDFSYMLTYSEDGPDD
ncbi:TIR domain-containing protein [Arthrobacter antibioticus]|uniref:TIR domain-containing protein n=1 Tax=Arthrobacter sp. H35-MC1 TaxID=3046203 RepID=UPI0024B99265|nr:TIR domain-containing protein [Arthrobacter sp. H35-MC1]MDJ0316170.1 TIR domain-containing protein [Arthrobacter sp. H35-MC1]